MVRDVSAIFVQTMIFLPGIPFEFAAGGASKIFYYAAGGRVEYNGTTLTGPQLSPCFSDSLLIYLQAVSISSSPVKNTNISPGSS